MNVNADIFGIPSFIVIVTVLPIALGFLIYSMVRWIGVVQVGQQTNRTEGIGSRMVHVLMYMFGQKRLFKYPMAGLMHAMIFWGFCVLSLRALSLILGAFWFEGIHAILSTTPGMTYLWFKDIFAGLVLFFVAVALFRRLVIKPSRIHLSGDALFVLTMISLIMITDFTMEGAFFNLELSPTRAYQPLSSLVALAMAGIPKGALLAIFKISFWSHILIILFFVNYLPYSKHFHVITSLPNLFFHTTKPSGKIPKMDLEDETVEAFGIGKVSDLNWKEIMDVYTCTECGRCHDHCPAWRSDKPLSPMKVNVTIRDHIQENKDYFLSLSEGHGDGENKLNTLVGDLIDPDVFWACTTCGYCENACPLFIENFQRFMGMRQFKVLMEGDFPAEAREALDGMEVQGNPWAMSPQDRDKWAEGLDVPRVKDGDFDILYWVGCAGSYDGRSKKVSQAMVKILKKAGVSFAILGNEERCTGDSARRMGNEYLFQSMATQNVEMLGKYKVKKILTTCPHCFNTFKQEYPDFGGHYEVVHHSEFIEELIRDGKIEVKLDDSDKVIFHDSCYLGRHNGVYSAPRKVIQSACGTVSEFNLNRQKGFCCGAGGGRMWMEETIGERINKIRLKQAEESQPQASVVGVSCPFCMTMFEDAITSEGKEEKLKTLDIAELVAARLL